MVIPKVFLIINESLIFPKIDKLANDIIEEIGLKIIPLILKFFNNRKDFIESSNKTIDEKYNKFWTNLFSSMDIQKSERSLNKVDKLWSALSMLSGDEGMRVYQPCKFLFENKKYITFVTTTALADLFNKITSEHSIKVINENSKNKNKYQEYVDLMGRLVPICYTSDDMQKSFFGSTRLKKNSQLIEHLATRLIYLPQEYDNVYILDSKITKKDLKEGLANQYYTEDESRKAYHNMHFNIQEVHPGTKTYE